MEPFKLAVASCAKFAQATKQPAWKTIQDQKPDLLLLGGDNVYLKAEPTDPVKLEKALNDRYDEQFGVTHFTNLLTDLKNRGKQVVPIYDDHDFLGDNRVGGDPEFSAGGENSLRSVARRVFVERWSDLLGTPIPTGPAGDVYRVVELDGIDLVVLDTRFHRISPSDAQEADKNAILGEEQWTWFDDVLKTHDARYTVVCSPITAHNFQEVADVESGRAETWERYPAAFDRLIEALKTRPGAIVVSGDVHVNKRSGDRDLLEVVTSGVARNSVADPTLKLRNWAMLAFAQEKLFVEQHGVKKKVVQGVVKWPATLKTRELPYSIWHMDLKQAVPLPKSFFTD